MEYLLNSEEMRSCDRRTEEVFGVPSIVLMERAALSCVEALLDLANGFDAGRVLVLCGSGNNGGDGFAIARILKERGSWYGDPFRWKRREADEKCQNPENDL